MINEEKNCYKSDNRNRSFLVMSLPITKVCVGGSVCGGELGAFSRAALICYFSQGGGISAYSGVSAYWTLGRGHLFEDIRPDINDKLSISVNNRHLLSPQDVQISLIIPETTAFHVR